VNLLQKRREQVAAVAKREAPTLFELKEDRRPIADRTAADAGISNLRSSPFSMRRAAP
jgi:hypothetical protein